MINWTEAHVWTRPITGGRWVRSITHIRNNATGEVRKKELAQVIFDGEKKPRDFIWKDVNFYCDCNREILFKEASGIKLSDAEFDQVACSEGNFSVNLENPVTGEIYYREFA